ncbi:MAG: hypothetical protein Q9227_005067 [Pyrenula ochraceoflavens]
MASNAFIDNRIRVQDYLNDKLQTESDLDGLGSLIESVEQQQELLRKQLEEANNTLRAATVASKEHEAALRSKAHSFQQEQDDLDQRLRDLTQSSTSDEAVKKFEASMEKLQKFDVSIGYMETLQEADNLGLEARKNIKQYPQYAISPYTGLRTLVTELKAAQPAAEGAAPHLIDHIEKRSNRLFEELKTAFSQDLAKTLSAMSWPEHELKLSEDLISRFSSQVELLLDLQEPDLKALSSSAYVSTILQQPPVLLPLEVITKPLELRFKYHFSGNRPTNRLDKPEYFLSNVLDILEAQSDFIVEYLQPLLDQRAQNTTQDLDILFTDSVSAFITALLPMIRSKILNLLPQIVDNANLLSHFMHELMKFDDTLRDTWGYTPASGALESWKGLTWEVLVTHSYFEAWLGVEQNFALSRYRTIIAAEDSGEIDYDTLEPGATKPTKGAVRVNDLLETTTDRYRPLSSFSQKLRFLIDIQIEIFDQYYNRLRDSLETYLALTTTIGRATMSDQKSDTLDLSGVAGLERLCRVLGSASYLEDKMSDWSEDVFFLELWGELVDRAQQNSNTNRSVARDLTTAQIVSKTSASLGNNGNADPDSDDHDENGALFDETASAYRRLRLRCESILVETLTSNVRSSLRSYIKLASWSSLSAPSSSPTPSPELDAALHLLTNQLPFLATVLSPAILRRITHQVCHAIQDFLWDRVLTRNTFSAAGAAQFTADIAAVCKAIDRAIRVDGESARSMRKLMDGLRLVGLPIRASGVKDRIEKAVEEEGEDDAWDLDNGEAGSEDVNSDDENSAKSNGDKIWGLWEVEKRLFKSNEEAREVLAEMDIGSLNESEARGIVEKRVEVGS